MFLYFAEGNHVAPPAELRYAFEAGISQRAVNAGPAGSAGVVFADSRMQRVGFFPVEQQWRKLPHVPYWVGWFVDADMPSPTDLKRRDMLQGHVIELGGQQWTVPVARSVTDDLRFVIALPRKVEIDSNGEWVYTGVVDRYRRLWEIGERWFDAVFDRGEKDDQGIVHAPLEIDEAFSLACEALAYNYRVGPVELSVLGALESGSYADILNAVIDGPRLQELTAAMKDKKKDDSAAA